MIKCLLSTKHLKTFNVLKHSTNAVLSIDNDEIKPCVYNRNPRNLERMRIAYKPSGFHLEAPGREFWHKIEVKQSNRYVTASVIHWGGQKVIEASTNEYAIKKYLYRLSLIITFYFQNNLPGIHDIALDSYLKQQSQREAIPQWNDGTLFTHFNDSLSGNPQDSFLGPIPFVLYTDATAYRNLAKVFAQRCLESGISNLYCNINAPTEGKIAVFLSEVEKSGLSLTEPTRYLPWRPWDRHRPEKPWETLE